LLKQNLYKLIKYLLVALSILFLYENSKENYKIVLEKIDTNILSICLIILIKVISQNILSLRTFIFVKMTSKYRVKFIQWNILYFMSALINSSPLWGIGHFIRSYEMKKKNYSFKEYISANFFIYFWAIFINSFLLISLFIIMDIKNYLILFLLLALFFFSIFSISPSLISILHNNLKRFNYFKIIKKYQFLNNLLRKVLGIIRISQNIFSKKVFKNFLIITIILFLFQYLILFFIFKFFFQISGFDIVLQFFILNYIIIRVPSMNSILGVRELILGIYSQYLGLIFLEGVVISLILRLLSIISLSLNFTIFNLIKKIN
jgi:hypothetical protein